MCQSKAQGGRRCPGKGRAARAAASAGTSVSTSVMAFDALIGVASHDEPASDQVLKMLSGIDNIDDVSLERRWETWTQIADSEHPSHAIRAMFDSGFSKNFPELHAVKDVPQDASWHPEGGVAEHLAQAADVAAQAATRDGLSGEERTVAVLASMCHDLGKATHTQIHSDGRITSRGHDVAGVKPAQSLIARMGGSESVQGKVGVLVLTHMRHINQPTLKSANKLKAALAEHGLSLRDWARVADADCGGRGEASQHGVGEAWLKFV